jgi:tRNA threonylcarbamoyladenosine biosynthesis protein TsaE
MRSVRRFESAKGANAPRQTAKERPSSLGGAPDAAPVLRRFFITHSAEDTRALGREIAAKLPERGIVLLIGELGAGKTTLAQGIAEGRGAVRAEDVSSPTFTLIHEYGDPVSVYHIDLYRLETVEEARRLGLEDIYDAPALVLVEWGERFPELLPRERAEIRIRHIGEHAREIELCGWNRAAPAAD